MVVGFNHNFRYKDVLYHIQTEDGGVKNPAIITHLFDGGTILATKKTSYADIIKVDSLEQVVEDLMKEQHRDMLRRLRKGEFDRIIARIAAGPSPTALEPALTPPPAGLAASPPMAPPVPPAVASPVTPVQVTPVQVTPVQATPVQATPVQVTPVQVTPVQVTPVQATPVQATPAPARPPAPPAAPTPAAPPADLADRVLEKSLDDIILSYLLGEEKSGNGR